jgi:uncharacterized membrane protein YtjA (UPF0391 family)
VKHYHYCVGSRRWQLARADDVKTIRNNWVSLTLLRHAAAVPQLKTRRTAMLGWAVTFLIVALVAALLGFGGIAGVAVEAAKIVFFVAIVLFAISVVAGLLRGRTVP